MNLLTSELIAPSTIPSAPTGKPSLVANLLTSTCTVSKALHQKPRQRQRHTLVNHDILATSLHVAHETTAALLGAAAALLVIAALLIGLVVSTALLVGLVVSTTLLVGLIVPTALLVGLVHAALLVVVAVAALLVALAAAEVRLNVFHEA